MNPLYTDTRFNDNSKGINAKFKMRGIPGAIQNSVLIIL